MNLASFRKKFEKNSKIRRVPFYDLRHHHPLGQDQRGPSRPSGAQEERSPKELEGLLRVAREPVGAQKHRRHRAAQAGTGPRSRRTLTTPPNQGRLLTSNAAASHKPRLPPARATRRPGPVCARTPPNAPTTSSPARGLRRAALDRTHRFSLALHAPNDLPPWEAVYQQTRRWLVAGVFEAMVHDLLRALLPLASGRTSDPTAAIIELLGRALRSSPESGHRPGYDGAKRPTRALRRRCASSPRIRESGV